MDILEDLREIDRIAQYCSSHGVGMYGILPMHRKFEAARDGILDALVEAMESGTECPPGDLFKHGWRAIAREVKGSRQDCAATPQGASYWRSPPPMPAPEDVIEPLALREVFATLPVQHQESLLVFAAHDGNESAAAHLGISRDAMRLRVRAARAAFFAAWFDWEQAPKLPVARFTRAKGDRCGQGHEFTPENTGWQAGRHRARTKRYCRACVARRTKERRHPSVAAAEGIAS